MMQITDLIFISSWECITCWMPNFTSTIFYLFDLDKSQNPFSLLSDPNDTIPENSLNSSLTSIGSPIHSSSPLKPKEPLQKLPTQT